MNIPPIHHALENITAACQKKLSLLYPKGVPEPVRLRYEQELSFLSHSDKIDDFELFRLLSEEAKKSALPTAMRGTVMGSLIYYLLGVNCFNPMPAHYYCPECGYYEEVHTHLFGIDLPPKKCPQCGSEISADGFSLPVESVWGSGKRKVITFDYDICTEFLPFARRILASAYPDNAIVPWGMFQLNGLPSSSLDNQIVGISAVGYAILPAGSTIQDYPDLISYLDNGETCLTGGAYELSTHFIRPVRLYPFENMEQLLQLQRKTGIYANEITPKMLRDITWSSLYNTALLNNEAGILFHEQKPKTFKEMSSLIANSHNTFSCSLNKSGQDKLQIMHEMLSSDAFKEYPCFTREDFFDYLLEAGVERSMAFDISERIRKGLASSEFGNPNDSFDALPIPENLKKVARSYSYIFPRAHVVESLLHCARLAYYAKIDSQAFSKIVLQKKPQRICLPFYYY